MFSFSSYFEESTNKEIRWYLERGASLTEAISLYERQWKRILARELFAFAVAFAANQPALSSTFRSTKEWSMDMETISEVLDMADAVNKVRHDWDYLEEAEKIHASSPVERRIQELAKKFPILIIKLPKL